VRDLQLRKLIRIARHLRSADGAEIAEVALVLPLVFMFLLGIAWFGRAFNIYATIQQAAQQGAIAAARSTCATCSPGNATASPVAVTSAVTSVMQSSNLSPSQITPTINAPPRYSCLDTSIQLTCPAPGGITICQQVLLNSPLPAGQTPQCGAIVSFRYPFPFNVPFTSVVNGVTLSAQAQSRMEN
jgi:TadE-like protein